MAVTSPHTVRLLQEQREELLEQLRTVSPELVEKLERTLIALQEQGGERGEYEGLDRAGVIRKYLLKAGRPTALRDIREAVAAPASRFDGRSIWDGAKRELDQGRLRHVTQGADDQEWVLGLPEWE